VVSTEDDRMLSDEEHDEALPGKLLYLVWYGSPHTAIWGMGYINSWLKLLSSPRNGKLRVSTLNGKAL
jgi:hypothetical protein